MVKVSIIVPVYQSERYLNRCVDSLLTQTFTDFELILVDDGSTDKSPAICDVYSDADARVRVLHINNSGAAAARNCGLDIAKGEYIAFCDSDDTVSEHWLERMVLFVSNDTLPIGAFARSASALDKDASVGLTPGEVHPASDYFLFWNAGISGFIPLSLFSRTIIEQNKIRFREQNASGDYNEDLIFTLSYVPHIASIVYTGYADYLYDEHEGSLSKRFYSCHFDKFAEKFRLWRYFITNQTYNKNDLFDLSTRLLYYFLVSLSIATEQKQGYQKFKSIVCSNEMQEALQNADVSKENPKIINLLKKKRALRLYAIYKLQNFKRRCKQ